jgi:hypothetical protein
VAGLVPIEPDVGTGRTLHLLDLENLSGHPRMGRSEAVTTVHAYLDLVGFGPTDLVRLACNPDLYWVIEQDLPPDWDVRPAGGANGADRALLANVDPFLVARRFHRLVIGSGDHAFTDLALQVRALGPDVWSVSRRGSLHHELRNSVSRSLSLGVTATV